MELNRNRYTGESKREYAQRQRYENEYRQRERRESDERASQELREAIWQGQNF